MAIDRKTSREIVEAGLARRRRKEKLFRGTGMLAKATELANAHGWFLCRQFENEANADVHSRTTAAEVVEDFAGQRLDYWVTGFGTGGTLKGVARVLRERRPDTRIVVVEQSTILSSSYTPRNCVPGSRTWPERPPPPM